MAHRLVVNCRTQRPPSLRPPHDAFRHNLNTFLSSTFKPVFKELQQLNIIPIMRIDFPIKHIIKKASGQLLDAFVDSTFKFVDQPLLPSQSNFAPVDELKEAVRISDIEGDIPDDFPQGVYIRNGPNPLFGGLKSTESVFGRSSHIWVEGEGMVHVLYFQKSSSDDGKWDVLYNNRYVEPETFKMEKHKKRPSFLPAIEGHSLAVLSAYLLNWMRFGKVNKYISNTNVIEHGGKFYATAENHAAQEFDILTLDTIGDWDINGAWTRPFTSHPKKDPSTGELITIGVQASKPFMELGVISAHRHVNNLIQTGLICRYNVILDYPLTIDIERLIKGGPLIKYKKEDYARIGVMPRYGDTDSIQWFDVLPNCTFHILNCFEHGDEVVVWGCRALDSIIPGPDMGENKFEWFSKRFSRSAEPNHDDESLYTRLYEWRLNMQTGDVKERNLTGAEASMDFPMIHPHFTGLKNNFGYTQIIDSKASSSSGMAKYGGLAKLDFQHAQSSCNMREDTKGEDDQVKVEYHKLGKNTFCSGAAFVPKLDAGGCCEEDDGWIITFVHNEVTDVSYVYIIDTKKFSSEPVAKITLPCRVPYGFHGAFMPMPISL
ncbi:Carotenoid 9,10(9',10')-cleavage dioxygenase 1 [Linum grandiflorum]